MTTIPGYVPFDFPGRGRRTVLRGGSGPPVIVLHELFGLTSQVVAFADRVRGAPTSDAPTGAAEAGRTVYLPVIAGPVPVTTASHKVRAAGRLCLSRQFGLLATGRTSPFVAWLRNLVVQVSQVHGGAGVAVVGMCFTGGFALALAASAPVSASVAAQPSLPFPIGRRRTTDLGMSPADEERLADRLAAGEVRVLGLRFDNDRMCPGPRFEALTDRIGLTPDDLDCLPSTPGNEYGFHPRSHSVLTNILPVAPAGERRLAEVTRQVLDFLAEAGR